MELVTDTLSYNTFGGGTPVLLIHGFAGTAQSHFERLISELASQYLVVAPDLRGHGGSRHLALACSELYFETHVKDIERLIAELKLGAVHLIGYSDGGEIAIKLAARLGDKALSFCVWGVSGIIPPDQIVDRYADAEIDTPTWTKFRHDLEALHIEQAIPLVRCWVQAMRCLRAVGGEISLAAAQEVRCRSLLVSGDRDPFNPLHSVRALANVLPNSELIVLSGAGHDLLTERGDQVVAVIRQFLNQRTDDSVQHDFRAVKHLIAELSPPPYLEIDGVGQVVVLLHGWGASHELFSPVLKLLRYRFRVISFDFPGFGSTPPPARGWSVHDYAEWVLDTLTRLGIQQAHFVGHSFGGRVAISIASRHPDKVGKLVLTGSAGIPPQRTLTYHLRVRLFKAGKSLVDRWFVPPPLRVAIQAKISEAGSADYQQASGTVRESFVRVVNEDLRPLLHKITAPTLLIWGDQDTDTPLADGKTMEQVIPDAGLIVFKGGGHYAYLEQVEYFCRILETFFLQS